MMLDFFSSITAYAENGEITFDKNAVIYSENETVFT